jgi:DNA polymerase-3 subunit epsilon
MLREIVLDTETTGTDHLTGDRIVEVGGIELLNHIPTGKFFHRYINPQRPVHQGAYEVHGLDDAFLAGHPVFAAVADELHQFLGDARLVIHNAAFDMAFLNAEFGRTGHGALPSHRALCTLMLARRRHPGAPASLDALCSRFGIDNSRRSKHGALLDAELLAEVYIELIGGRQTDLGLTMLRPGQSPLGSDGFEIPVVRAPRPPVFRLTETERDAHRAFVAGALGSRPVWGDYIAPA